MERRGLWDAPPASGHEQLPSGPNPFLAALVTLRDTGNQLGDFDLAMQLGLSTSNLSNVAALRARLAARGIFSLAEPQRAAGAAVAAREDAIRRRHAAEPDWLAWEARKGQQCEEMKAQWGQQWLEKWWDNLRLLTDPQVQARRLAREEGCGYPQRRPNQCCCGAKRSYSCKNHRCCRACCCSNLPGLQSCYWHDVYRPKLD